MAPTFLLAGELGSGKRTLARHLAKRFGYSLLSINGWELPGGYLHPFFHLIFYYQLPADQKVPLPVCTVKEKLSTSKIPLRIKVSKKNSHFSRGLKICIVM